MHMPYRLLPLAGDYVMVIASGFGYGYSRLGLPLEIKGRTWNGFAYFAADVAAPEAEHKAIWERRNVAARAQIPITDAYWRERALPELRAAYAWLAGLPVETLPAVELADAW